MKQTATNASGLTLAQWIRAASFAQGHGLGPSDFREARRDWEAAVDPAEWGRPRSPRRHATKKKTVAEYRVWGSSPVKGETTYYRGTDRSAAEAAFDDRVYRNFEGMADDEEDVIIESAGRKIRRFGADVFRPTYFGNPRAKTAARGHATKKSPMQLQHEIDEVLANPGGASGTFDPPRTMNVVDRHGGFTAVTRSGTLWRPGKAAPGGTFGSLVPGSVKHDDFYQNKQPVVSALYKLPSYGYKVKVWWEPSGERIA